VSSESRLKKRLGLRISAFLLGIIVLIWLTIEDENTIGVVVISGAICIWAAFWVLVKPVEGGSQIILRHSLVGLGAGLAVSLLGILLMALKSGIHGHSSPDYSIAQMQEVLSRTPFFALSGFLVGLGSGFWRLARSNASADKG
jgi:hypothetical protein